MVKKLSYQGEDLELAPIEDKPSVEARLDALETALDRILAHLDPHGTSRPLRENSEEQ
jgi:hypothetical protein